MVHRAVALVDLVVATAMTVVAIVVRVAAVALAVPVDRTSHA